MTQDLCRRKGCVYVKTLTLGVRLHEFSAWVWQIFPSVFYQAPTLSIIPIIAVKIFLLQ